MASTTLSKEILKIYDGLPPEAQRAFIEKTFAELLQNAPEGRSDEVKTSVLNLKQRYDGAPKLDLFGKHKQMDMLFEVLAKESKLSLFGDRSNREEVLAEIVVTLTSWLGDIWRTVYEYRTNFNLAHRCLLFVSDSLKQLDEGAGSRCRCDFINIPVHIVIKDKTGKTVKVLNARGAQEIERVIFWIWRDMCLCILSEDPEQAKTAIPRMLEDIEHVYGFPSMKKLLFGGKKTEEEEEEEEDLDGYVDDAIYDEDEDGYESDSSYAMCPFHSSHWDGQFGPEAQQLRVMVEDFMFTVFTATPSLPLYNLIIDVSADRKAARTRVSTILEEVAGSTAESLIAALGIAITNDNTNGIVSLLDEYGHLLRPRDATVLQGATATLSNSEHHARALTILESELDDTLQSIYRAVRSSFSHFEEPQHLKTLSEIMKMRSGSSQRQDRIETWTESVLTSPSGSMGSMAFAAMMIGLPVPGMGEEGEDNSDLLNLIDMENPHDPDYDDIREEFRPNLKQRFEGWANLGSITKGGPTALAKLYAKAIELMPFLKAADVTQEMAARLGDRPSKVYVSDALMALSSFCKSQRKKINATRKDSERKAQKAAAKALRAAIDAADARAVAEAEAAGASPTPTSNGAFSFAGGRAFEVINPQASGSGSSNATAGTSSAPGPSSTASTSSAPGPSQNGSDLESITSRMRMAGQAAASADIASALSIFLNSRSSTSGASTSSTPAPSTSSSTSGAASSTPGPSTSAVPSSSSATPSQSTSVGPSSSSTNTSPPSPAGYGGFFPFAFQGSILGPLNPSYPSIDDVD
ncbi:hypothetical protein CC2G_011062 [Coprinopsis cinerea AmutBmut pab1-1]|nr:hypothetical protein CC2G_011062 [Coprinopsis cinerea AmutBmut pab1-1]